MPDTDTPSAEELAAALDAHNRWRRGDDEPAPDPTKLGKTIDAAADALRSLASERDAQVPRLTDEHISDAVRDADLDWHHGWTLDETQPNRFTQLARAVESRVRELCGVAP